MEDILRGPERNLLKAIAAPVLAVVISACASSQAGSAPVSPATDARYAVVLASEVQFDQLNPARGDQSPKAGTLWGDRAGTGPTGFLFAPVDGFQSPPHVHNVSYRGVVIRGLVHNDDPAAQNIWMPTGSFWTQPKGHVHITAAKGSDTLAYIEIEAGPYLVFPTDKAFASGEVPVNVDATNIVWLDASDTTWVDASNATEPQVSFVWRSPENAQLNGSLVQLPTGFTAKINTRGPSFRAVMVRGQLAHRIPKAADSTALAPGDYFSSEGNAVHHVACSAAQACVFYVRADGSFRVTP